MDSIPTGSWSSAGSGSPAQASPSTMPETDTEVQFGKWTFHVDEHPIFVEAKSLRTCFMPCGHFCRHSPEDYTACCQCSGRPRPCYICELG